jgi:hypothetical protein
MTVTVVPLYGTKTDLTISPENLASSATFVAGVESNQIDNTTNRYDDALLDGFVTVGTTPTINTKILVFVWGANVSLATQALDVLDGTASAETITSAGVMYGVVKQAVVLTVDSTTTDRRYGFSNISVKRALGLEVLPPFWGVFVAHNTGVNTNVTAGNHKISYVGVKREIVTA